MLGDTLEQEYGGSHWASEDRRDVVHSPHTDAALRVRVAGCFADRRHAREGNRGVQRILV